MPTPKFVPTDEQRRLVEHEARRRTPQDEIASQLNIVRSTLRRYFRAELDICNRTAGRPSWEPTDEQRREVMILTAGGFLQDAIALRFDISVDTLRFYCAREIDIGKDTARAEAFLALYKKAIGEDARPNVAGIDKLLKRIDVLPPQPRQGARKAPMTPGKKQEAIAAAATADQGTSWADLLARNEPLN